MCESEYIKNIKGLYLLYKNIKVNNRIYNEHFKNRLCNFFDKLYVDLPYQHTRKCVCNYNCEDCWKFSCESCKKGFNNQKLKCGNKNCYKYLKHVVPEVFGSADSNISMIVDNFCLTFIEANEMEKSLKDGEKLVFIKLLL
jgi:hypothetical protein